jgi:hypothetical protein
MRITGEELKKRVAAALARTVVAGPDHPIYTGGLMMNSIPGFKPSTTTSPPDEVDANPVLQKPAVSKSVKKTKR